MQALKSQLANEQIVSLPQRQSYQIRIADKTELMEVFRLRYEIFYEEMGAHSPHASANKLDIDEYDELCDHLIVTHQGKIVGTYRLMPLSRISKTSLPCYSQNEFQVKNIRNFFSDSILELGRSCIHKEHRNGQVAKLLWAGIASYLQTVEVDALFGCVSLHGLTHNVACAIRSYFQVSGNWHATLDVPVIEKFQTPHNDLGSFYYENPQELEKLLPPLVGGYLNLGAKIVGGPAYDADFHCHDFLILLETKNISQRYLQFLSRFSPGFKKAS